MMAENFMRSIEAIAAPEERAIAVCRARNLLSSQDCVFFETLSNKVSCLQFLETELIGTTGHKEKNNHFVSLQIC